MTGRKIQYWVIPPEADAEFVAQMEEVLEEKEKTHTQGKPGKEKKGKEEKKKKKKEKKKEKFVV